MFFHLFLLNILFRNFVSNTLDFVNLQEEFASHPGRAITKGYDKTDKAILSHSPDLGRGGSTAVTVILINDRKLWFANVGDSRAVLLKGGRVMQMTVDHEPSAERWSIENKGGFVSNIPGNSGLFLIYCMLYMQMIELLI